MPETKVEITAVDKTAAAFQSAEKNIKAFEKQLDGLKGLMVGVAAGAMAELIKTGLDYAETVDEMAKRTGFSTKALQELQFAGVQLGAKTEAINEALTRFSRTIGDAAAGSDEARAALQRVGIQVTDLKSLSIEQLFDRARVSLSQMSSESRRLSAENDVFGKGSKEVASFLSAQTAEMVKLRAEAHALGAVLSEESIAKAKETKDKFEALARVLSVQLSDAVVQIAPLLVKTATVLGDVARMARSVAENMGLIERTGTAAYDALLEKGARLREDIASQEATSTSWLNSLLGPTDEAKQRLAALRAELQQVEAQLADMRKKGVTPPPEKQKAAVDLVETSKGDQKKIDDQLRLEQYYRDRLKTIQDSFLTENDLLLKHHQEQQAIIEANYDLGRISEQQAKAAMEELELQHQAKLGDITAQGILQRRAFEQMNARQQTQAVLGELLSLTEGVAAHNKTMFAINKAAGIANAIINTSLGVTKALSAYPPPLSIAMAAIQLAAGMAQVKQIKDAQFGSSSSAPSVAGGGAVPTTPAESPAPLPSNFPTPQNQGPTRNVNLNIRSRDMFSAASIRDEIIPELNDAVGDGVNLTVSIA